MKGYAGREAPPRDAITVGAGHVKLQLAIEQVQLANKMAEKFKTKFLRVSPDRFGVNFVTHGDDGKVNSLVEVGELPFTTIKDSELPIVYPADPFLTIPTLLLIRHPVRLIVRFKDAVAWATVTAPEDGKSAGFIYRAGSLATSEETEVSALVIQIPAEDFKIVQEKQ